MPPFGRKKVRFNVGIDIEEVVHLPVLNGVFFVKIDTGSQKFSTKHLDVSGFSVRWNEKFSFDINISTRKEENLLEPCPIRLGVWQEEKGGLKSARIGVVVFDLSEFSGQGETEKNVRLDDTHLTSIQFKVNMRLLSSGDPIFKTRAPTLHRGMNVVMETLDSIDSIFENFPVGVPFVRLEATPYTSEDIDEHIRPDEFPVDFEIPIEDGDRFERPDDVLSCRE